MRSCIYRGHVRHRRFADLNRQFRYPISFLYLDLDELPTIAAQLPCFSRRRFAVASVCREDHLGNPRDDLAMSVRQLVREQSDEDVRGPVGLLTLWRSFGIFFSPVNLYFLHDLNETLTAVVAEVSNTPWRERHNYVLAAHNQTAADRRGFRHAKEFHVSPFLRLDLEYRWRITPPQDSLTVHLEAWRVDRPQLDATLTLHRRELTACNWLMTVARYPCLWARVLSGIYWEAFWLWINKAPFYPHPRKGPPADPPSARKNLSLTRRRTDDPTIGSVERPEACS